MTTEVKYTAWDLLNDISMGNKEQNVAEKIKSEIAYHLDAVGEEVSDDMFLNISRLEDKDVMSVFDKDGHILFANLGVEYDFLDLVHRKEQIALHMKDVEIGTDLGDELGDIYDKYVNSVFHAAGMLMKYAVMTDEVIIPLDMETKLTPENVSEWLDDVPGGDLIEIATEARYNMRGYCDMKFDNLGYFLPEKSRGDIDTMEELAELENSDLERD